MDPRGTSLIIFDVIEPRDVLFLPNLKNNVKEFQLPEAGTHRPLNFVNLTIAIKFTIGN